MIKMEERLVRHFIKESSESTLDATHRIDMIEKLVELHKHRFLHNHFLKSSHYKPVF